MSTAWIDELAWSAEGPPWLAMGLSRVDEARWLLPDEHRAAELAERRLLLEERRDEVVGLLPGTEAAGAEVLDLVLRWQADHAPDQRAEPVAHDDPPLVAAARRVQEDLVVMVERGGAHHLDAAVVCFPSHWRLADKLGGSASAIHGPVPGYRDELADKVDRFLARLRPGAIAARRNWTVHRDDARFAPVRPAVEAPLAVHEVADGLWLRSERQTLRRLPATGAVLFTIRVQQAPFGALADRPSAAAALAARLRAQPAALTAMNGLAGIEPVVLAWLDAAAAD